MALLPFSRPRDGEDLLAASPFLRLQTIGLVGLPACAHYSSFKYFASSKQGLAM